jgi:hypothetical protein
MGPTMLAFVARVGGVAVIVLAIAGLLYVLGVGRHRSVPPQPRLRVSVAVDAARVRGPQSEAAVAVDPKRPATVVAGANDLRAYRMRVYESVDGGRSWASRLLPSPAQPICGESDPAVAIADDGAAYYSFLGIRCAGRRISGTSLYVAVRKPGSGVWRAAGRPVAAARQLTLADDRPSIAIDEGLLSPHRGRIYVAWSRFTLVPGAIWEDPDQAAVDVLNVAALVSHSDDHGRHWSKPVTLTDLGKPLEVRLAVGREGTVYAVWRDLRTDAIYVTSSLDGVDFLAPTFIGASVVRSDQSCHSARARIPAQPRRCVSPNPVIAVDSSTGPRAGRVYLVWGSTSLTGSQGVYLAVLSQTLQPLFGVGHPKQVDPQEGFRLPDRFLPTAALDSTTGRLFVCYYQTGAPSAKRARFECTASDDGGTTWLRPVPLTRWYSNETKRPANITNGYGDYEGLTAANGTAIAAWTDSRLLATEGEEIYTARIR